MATVKVKKVRDVPGFRVLDENRQEVDIFEIEEAELAEWQSRGWDPAAVEPPAKKRGAKE